MLDDILREESARLDSLVRSTSESPFLDNVSDESARLDSLVRSTSESPFLDNVSDESPDLNIVAQVSPGEKTGSVSEESADIETVLKAPLGDQRRKTKARPTGIERLSESFSSVFGCGPSMVNDQTYITEFPTGVVIQEDGDSVGELTATTYERKLQQKLLKKYEPGFPVPIACGGSGVVFTKKMSLVQKNESTGDFFHCDKTEAEILEPENYFADYDQGSLPGK
jgi:hypothetical protein